MSDLAEKLIDSILEVSPIQPGFETDVESAAEVRDGWVVSVGKLQIVCQFPSFNKAAQFVSDLQNPKLVGTPIPVKQTGTKVVVKMP